MTERQTRAQRAVVALRTPDPSLARVANTVRQSIADVIEAQETALRQFADRANWHESAGCQQWMGKRDAVDYAESVIHGERPPKSKED